MPSREKKPRKIKKPGYWWISFVGDEGFRGVCIVMARDVIEAITRTHQLGVNPGGEAACFPILASENYTEEFMNRLLSKADVIALQGEAVSVRELRESDPERARELGWLK